MNTAFFCYFRLQIVWRYHILSRLSWPLKISAPKAHPCTICSKRGKNIYTLKFLIWRHNLSVDLCENFGWGNAVWWTASRSAVPAISEMGTQMTWWRWPRPKMSTMASSQSGVVPTYRTLAIQKDLHIHLLTTTKQIAGSLQRALLARFCSFCYVPGHARIRCGRRASCGGFRQSNDLSWLTHVQITIVLEAHIECNWNHRQTEG